MNFYLIFKLFPKKYATENMHKSNIRLNNCFGRLGLGRKHSS